MPAPITPRRAGRISTRRPQTRQSDPTFSRIFFAFVASLVAVAAFTAVSNWEQVTQPVENDIMPSGD
jgi:hypothetical protein